MNKLTLAGTLLALSLALSACSKLTTIDASSPARMKETSDIIRAGLSGDELRRYDRSVTLIIANVLDPVETINLASTGAVPTEASVFARIKPAFDGLNKNEVMERGEVAAKSVDAKVGEWKDKRRALQSRYRAFEGGSLLMQKVSATSVNLRSIESPIPGFGENQVMLDITVTNTLDAPLKKATFNVALMPPGIASPWVTQPFTKDFNIPAGATGQIEVGPITVSIPETYKGPVTLETEVEFTRLEPAGQPPLVLPTWTQYDLVALSKLEAAITEVENVLRPVTPAAVSPALAKKES